MLVNWRKPGFMPLRVVNTREADYNVLFYELITRQLAGKFFSRTLYEARNRLF